MYSETVEAIKAPELSWHIIQSNINVDDKNTIVKLSKLQEP